MSSGSLTAFRLSNMALMQIKFILGMRYFRLEVD